MGVKEGEQETGGVRGADDSGEGVYGGMEGVDEVGVDGGR